LICAVAILITLLATVAPLRRITRMDVIDVIRQVY
jgi:ABC-type lipoprotein release transport system permease subunit